MKLSCVIENPGGLAISHLHEGIKLGFEGQVEKMSETLQKNCVYNKKSQLDNLPKYLVVNFMRFT